MINTIDRSKLDLPADIKQPLLLYPGEIEVLIALARYVNAQTVIEFGVHEGETARQLIRSVTTIERYFGIDVLPGYQATLPQQQSEIPKRPAHYVKGDPLFTLILKPNGTRDLTAKELPKADFIFIDGDHSRDGVLYDSKLAIQLLSKNGVIVWHDYYDEMDSSNIGVKSVIDELAYAAGMPILRMKDTSLVFTRPLFIKEK